jgi:predicted RNA-binding protein with PIN domain
MEKGAAGLLAAGGFALLVDGWNVCLNHVAPQDLRRRRAVLDNALAAYAARSGCRVIAVYDGRAGVVSPSLGAGLQSMFTGEQITADECIVELVESGGLPALPVVATSDGRLADRCRLAGALVIEARELALFLKIKPSPGPPSTAGYSERRV